MARILRNRKNNLSLLDSLAIEYTPVVGEKQSRLLLISVNVRISLSHSFWYSESHSWDYRFWQIFERLIIALISKLHIRLAPYSGNRMLSRGAVGGRMEIVLWAYAKPIDESCRNGIPFLDGLWASSPRKLQKITGLICP